MLVIDVCMHTYMIAINYNNIVQITIDRVTYAYYTFFYDTFHYNDKAGLIQYTIIVLCD